MQKTARLPSSFWSFEAEYFQNEAKNISEYEKVPVEFQMSFMKFWAT